MNRHALKVLPRFFAEIETDEKTFELRKNDRGFEVGDVLYLREWTKEAGFTGRAQRRIVTSIVVDGYGLLPGYVCMSVQRTRQRT